MMNWICVNNIWVAEIENMSFSIRWTSGAWHWRAVYFLAGHSETAQLAGDNRRAHPKGFLSPQDAMRAAERWFDLLNGGDRTVVS
jgi:hypothetical protein